MYINHQNGSFTRSLAVILKTKIQKFQLVKSE